jgi:hypothetical protein
MLRLTFVKFYGAGRITVEECELQRSCLVTVMNHFLTLLSRKFIIVIIVIVIIIIIICCNWVYTRWQ